MAYHQNKMSATFVPGMDDYWQPPPAPELVAPEPQRINPDMSNQIAGGIENLDLNARARQGSGGGYKPNSKSQDETPHLSPFPKLVNPPPNVPPSDEELESTLENARSLVLGSNDPEMQLAWASDALVYVGVCADYEERLAAAKPHSARSATPRVEHELKTDAMAIVNFLADQHHPKAEFLKGMWLEWGRFGQREDKKEAFRCYSRAADRGYARAEYRIGMLHESYNDPAKALRHYHRGVEAGDAASCYRLGMMTLRGQHGQQQDYAKAVTLIRQSAEGADENAAQGAYVYGMLLARLLPQIDIPEQYLALDERQARMNIEKAAYLKFAKAQLKMGSAYELGSLGCDFNPALSMHYNALASKQGEAEADMAISKWFLVGADGLFPKNEELAYTYAERASQSGLGTAEFALGYFNEIGMYVPVNLEKAKDWYQKASNHGNADASGRLDGLAKKQVLSKKDHEKVAVNRIKSMHGSMRGQRPNRIRPQQAPILDQVVESPATPASYSNGKSYQASGVVQPPPRGSSRTPYPEENVLPTATPPVNRASNITPYPLEDGPPKPQRLGPTGGFFNAQPPPARPVTTLNPDVRPSSAFQINPNLRPNSIAVEQQPQPFLQPQQAGPRPSTTQPYDQRVRPPPGQRVASGPANPQAYSQNYPPQPGRPSPQPQRPPLPPKGPQEQPPSLPQIPPTQKLDIGFSAPVDARRRQYGPARPADAVPSAYQAAPPKAAMGPGPADARRPNASTPQPPQPQKQNTAPVKQTVPPKPVQHAPTAPVASKPQQPPGKGPKTFDEMGVPQTKQDSDCVMM